MFEIQNDYSKMFLITRKPITSKPFSFIQAKFLVLLIYEF